MAEKKKKTAAGGSSGSRASGGKSSSGAKKNTKNTSGSSRKNGSSDRAAAARARVEENRRRRRRTAWAVVLLCLGVFSFLGYFNTDGVVIRFLRGLLTGLFGGGFYILPPMLLLSAAMLAISEERTAAERALACAAAPILISAFCQLFSKSQYALSFKMFSYLWADGQGLAGGGAVGGAISILFTYLFSKPGAAIVLVCLSAMTALGIAGLTLRALIGLIRSSRKQREEREYEEYLNEPEPEPEKDPRGAGRSRDGARPADVRSEPPRRQGGKRSSIDIPMDEEPAGAAEKPRERGEEKPKRPSLFDKNPNVPTPDTVLTDAVPAKPESAPEPEVKPAPEPRPAPVPIPVEVVRTEPERPAVKKPEPEIKPEPKPETKPAPAPEPEVKPAPEPASERDSADREAEKIASLIEESARRDAAEAVQEYKFPPVSLLTEPKRGGSRDSQDELTATKERLELCLRSFGVNAKISNIVHGPSITRYEMELEIGVKLNKITNLSDDIALALGVSGVRIAAIPNRISTVGIEVPNKHVSTVYLREIITAPEFVNAKSKLTFAIGKNIAGEVMVGNISKLPHLLVAGTTGSGKSVCLNSLILSLMYKATPEEVKFIMVDPKMVEFKIYNGIPHLLIPVVTEAKKAAGALQWAVVEMMKRYRLFSDAGARDLASYNEQLEPGTPKIPQIVVIIDELADLMMIAAKEVEESICRVAQMGRAAGVHLVIATQSPRADVITGLMKANIPSRIALKVASSLESRIILDAGGAADKLVGNGDMLYAPIGVSKPARIQGTWVSDEEREAVVNYVKSLGEASYSEDVIHEIEKAVQDKESGGKNAQQPAPEEKFKDYDELLPQAAEIIFETKTTSVSWLQRRLKLGYARAARIVDQLEEIGVLGPFEGSKPRQIIITYQQWQEMQFVHGTAPIGPSAEKQAPVPDATDDEDNE